MATRPLLSVGVRAGGAGSAASALGPPLPGRPVSNIGKYLIKPTAEVNTGFEMINSDPNILKEVHQKYLKAFMLPPALQPKYLRKPEVMDHQRANAISRGWRDPRGRKGA